MSTASESTPGLVKSILLTLTNPFRFSQRRMLAESASDETIRLQASSIVVIDILQAPGTVKATDTHLILQPCLGKPKALAFEDIREVEQTDWFNGSKRVLDFQHGFWLKGAGYGRVGFAVSHPEPWQALFREHGVAA